MPEQFQQESLDDLWNRFKIMMQERLIAAELDDRRHEQVQRDFAEMKEMQRVTEQQLQFLAQLIGGHVGQSSPPAHSD